MKNVKYNSIFSELIQDFIDYKRVAGYKTSIKKKSVVYANNKQSKEDIKTVSFTIASKNE